jgi:hypothetical protein
VIWAFFRYKTMSFQEIEMRLLFCIGAGLACMSTVAVAENARPADKVVCKRSETPETGSRIHRSKRVCRTASEWKQLELAAQRTMENAGMAGEVDSRGPSAGAGPH